MALDGLQHTKLQSVTALTPVVSEQSTATNGKTETHNDDTIVDTNDQEWVSS